MAQADNSRSNLAVDREVVPAQFGQHGKGCRAALYPVSMQQLIDIADTGNIMPPKTTWFEPKLRSGLVIHKLD